MYRLLFLLAGVFLSFSMNAKTLYSCFLSQDLNMDTSEVSNFITDPSADWVTRNAIVIWYDEISPVAKWYQSRDPQER